MMRLMNATVRTRRAVVMVMDILIMVASLLLFSFVRGFSGWLSWQTLGRYGAILICSTALCVLVLGANRSLWRYADAEDYLRLIAAYGCGFIITLIIYGMGPTTGGFSRLFLLAAASLSLLLSIFARVGSMYIRKRVERARDGVNSRKPACHMAIIGAGEAGATLLNELRRSQRSPYAVEFFFDDDPEKIGRYIHGVRVAGAIKDIPTVLAGSDITDIAIAIPSLELGRRRAIVDMCDKLNCRLKILPDTVLSMERGGSLSASMRDVKVEDLLGRNTASIASHEMDDFIKGRTVMITGGGGSVGSELCRQIAKAGAGKIVVFDICENDTYMLYRELMKDYDGKLDLRVEIGTITDKKHVDDLFRQYRPDVVFHAAAHKHVPLMEDCPYEAVRNNIFGTYNLLMACEKFACPKFVLISTDKAVNPTNIMGATKRYCELMLCAVAGKPGCVTDFVAVRFGNVLGSHGSVLPLFQKQLEYGGPITVTDMRITRYFMTIPEAASLVIRAGSMAKRSELYILDMGEPVKIKDLAENFVRLSGYEPYKEIDIIETGLRPGEKLYEELLVNKDKHMETADSKIFVEKNAQQLSMGTIEQGLDELWEATENGSGDDVTAVLRRLVPTFIRPEDCPAAGTRESCEHKEKETVGAGV